MEIAGNFLMHTERRLIIRECGCSRMRACIFMTPTFNTIGLTTRFSEFVFLLIGTDGEVASPLGSGFFIAPEVAMTARHVVKGFWQEFQSYQKFPKLKTEVEANFKVLAFQFFGDKSEPAVWYIEKTWISEFTDTAFLYLKPYNDKAKGYIWRDQLELSMFEPFVGEQIFAFGYPDSKVELQTQPTPSANWKLKPTLSTGEVKTVHERYRDRGLLTWPVIETNARFDHGMSGGPVFNDKGQVCAMVCGGIGSEEEGYVSSGSLLWLAMLTGIDLQTDEIIAKEQYWAFDLFDINFLRQTGWETVFADKLKQFEIINDDDDNHVIEWKHGNEKQQVDEV